MKLMWLCYHSLFQRDWNTKSCLLSTFYQVTFAERLVKEQKELEICDTCFYTCRAFL